MIVSSHQFPEPFRAHTLIPRECRQHGRRVSAERDTHYRSALRIRVRNINAEVAEHVARIEALEAEIQSLIDAVVQLGASRRDLVQAGWRLTERIKRAEADERRHVVRRERVAA